MWYGVRLYTDEIGATKGGAAVRERDVRCVPTARWLVGAVERRGRLAGNRPFGDPGGGCGRLPRRSGTDVESPGVGVPQGAGRPGILGGVLPDRSDQSVPAVLLRVRHLPRGTRGPPLDQSRRHRRGRREQHPPDPGGEDGGTVRGDLPQGRGKPHRPGRRRRRCQGGQRQRHQTGCQWSTTSCGGRCARLASRCSTSAPECAGRCSWSSPAGSSDSETSSMPYRNRT